MEELEQRGELEAAHTEYLAFKVGTEAYGIEINYVTEIIDILPITEVPEVPPYIKGIVNMRGKILPVMDVRIRFNMEPEPYNDRTCIIIIDKNGIVIGIIVDSVEEIYDIEDDSVVPPPDVDTIHQYVRGIAVTDNGTKLLLDCDRLVSDDLPGAHFL